MGLYHLFKHLNYQKYLKIEGTVKQDGVNDQSKCADKCAGMSKCLGFNLFIGKIAEQRQKDNDGVCFLINAPKANNKKQKEDLQRLLNRRRDGN